jgi:hypothetical protein
MLNYQEYPRFSLHRSRQRLEKANRILGQPMVRRILAFALYLLGANVQSLAGFLKVPHDTIKSVIDRVATEGLPAFEDRRRTASTFVAQSAMLTEESKLVVEDELVTVYFGGERKIRIPRRNKFQCRTVLLTMLDSGVLGKEIVAEALELSTERTRKLKTALFKNDVHAVMDQRRGQQVHYRITSEIQAELIQQYVLNLNSRTSTSSQQLSKDLHQRCELELSPRTIRLHVVRMGLENLRISLPHLLQDLKKTLEA